MSEKKHPKISLFAAIVININIMIGAGIFITPPIMAQKSGPLSFLGWGLSAIIFLPLVFSIAKISKFLPDEGSFFNYARSGLGTTAGFLCGWAYFLTYLGAMSVQGFSFRELLIARFDLPLIAAHPIIFNLFFFAIFYLLSLISIKIVSKIQSILTFAKLLPLIILILAALYLLLSGKLILKGYSAPNYSLLDLKYSIPLAIFGFWGFESCCSISHLIEEGEKNASRAILLGFFITVLIYTVFHLGLIQIMGFENLATQGTSGFISFLYITSPLILSAISTIIIMSIFCSYAGAIYGEVNAQSFLLNSMAKEKIVFFPNFLKKMNVFHRPYTAMFTQSFLAFAFLSLINHKVTLISITNLGQLFTLTLTLVSLIVILVKKNALKEIITPIIGIISCLILGYFSWIEIGSVIYILPFVSLLIIGLIIFKFQTACPKSGKSCCFMKK
ncbi:TPA: hypothetical protein DEO28_00615 [Candidatus Dependentiae bacterium]|nr:MAG: Amino acid permease-associated region [candidate division TM6 bacterium GW2011_GWE2_31_21]KKP54094.1 MAG: Amino acid permease-associated region [candidate division TM6 bacterium GW2011_GWF2_33_332]HBS48324.1 hypothetical protein [Candidatus Dependentiae bacterium]HBZ73002.1 hypothetical protein [Candidatus Dependentiae bacterium]